MLLIGSHVSYKKDSGLLGSAMEAYQYGATTFMFYTGAPQNTARSVIDQEKVNAALNFMEEHNIQKDKVIVHAPYIINLANSDEAKFAFSCRFLKEELKRVAACQMTYLVLHPGSHVGLGEEAGIASIIKALNEVLESDDSNITILLETMAGKGTEIGCSFEQLKQIMDGVIKKERIGICLDTCHLNDAGYDISDFDSIIDTVDNLIGIEKIKCVHINDSKNIRGAHKDRHENFGFGNIGFDTLLNIIYHPKLEAVPKILETPYVDKLYPPYKEEIEMIKAKEFNSNLLDKIRERSK